MAKTQKKERMLYEFKCIGPPPSLPKNTLKFNYVAQNQSILNLLCCLPPKNTHSKFNFLKGIVLDSNR